MKANHNIVADAKLVPARNNLNSPSTTNIKHANRPIGFKTALNGCTGCIKHAVGVAMLMFIVLSPLPGQTLQKSTGADMPDKKAASDKNKGKKDKSDIPDSSDTTSSHVFELGDVIIVTGKKTNRNNTISQKNISDRQVHELSRAIEPIPGVHLSNTGGRNEPGLFIRGFDLRQIPIFLDGIPVYIPYDGYADLARFFMFNIAEVRVEKGFSSMMYGPNTMGGAINLVTQKPMNLWEINGSSGMISGKGYYTYLNAGTKANAFYAQANYSIFNRQHINLSKDFTANDRESGLNRENSYNRDQKAEVKIAYTPNMSDEYALIYSMQQGEKGIPVSTRPEDKARYWQMPAWNKQSVYFISRTVYGKQRILTRLYFDTFDNEMKSFDNDQYNTQTKPYAFTSIYDDYSYGGSLEWHNDYFQNNTLKTALHYKNDVHRSHDEGNPVAETSDATFSLGAENIYHVTRQFDITAGVSINQRANLTAQTFEQDTLKENDSTTSQAVNALLGIVYQTKQTKISLSAERKTRFPTMKDRYSYRLGRSISNPDLTPENTWNFDLTWEYFWDKNFHFAMSGFYSSITDTLQEVYNVDPTEPQIYQFQNTGKARFYGMESSLQYKWKKFLHWGINYTFIRRENIATPDIKFTHIPQHSLYTFMQLLYGKDYHLLISIKYDSQRYVTSDSLQVASFVIFNADIKLKIVDNLFFQGGVHNILDKNYEMDAGYPEQGRNFIIGLQYRIAHNTANKN